MVGTTEGRQEVGITIGSNTGALKAQRQLNRTARGLSSTFERLASGQRINKASDDPAGLAVAVGLHADRLVYTQSVRNFSDGISTLNVIDGALGNQSNILGRLKELGNQAANGAYSSTQRQAIDTEAQSLRNEYNRITASTKVNYLGLLDGSLQSLTLQGGYGTTEQLTIPLSSYATNGSSESTTTVGTGTFQSGISYSTIAGPVAVRSVDVNGDGKLDLVAADYVNAITVQLGNGNGTFQATVSYAGGAANDLIAADLNGDGKLDVVTTDSGGVNVQLGNGNGSFQTKVFYSSGMNPWDVIAADLNGDGKLDLVQGGGVGVSSVSIEFGNGDGTFLARVSYATGASPHAVVATDVNSDGKVDLITADFAANTVSVQLGNGNGTFQARASYSAGTSPDALVAADLNGDGKLDVVSADYNSNTVSVQLGNGDGSFQARISYVTTQPGNLTATDLNGDGKLDLITPNYGSNTVSVQLGNGDGSFQARVSYATGALPYNVTSGDLNGDGVPDIVTPNSGDNSLSVLLANTSTITTPASSDYTLPSFTESSLRNTTNQATRGNLV